MNIQGHTDDVPVATERFPTNWELSAARATAVLRFFIDKGIEPKRLTATGYADIFPLFSNDTEQGRAQNRRVEFVLEKEKDIRKS
ncbi:MAG: flagellar motor protein MotB [Nitrospinales bacterium]